jgi:hypothetical protein
MPEFEFPKNSYRSEPRNTNKPLRLADRIWVVKWAGHTFSAPVPLIPRYEVRVGDRIDSSHYGAVYVERTTADERHPQAVGAVQFWMKHNPRPTNNQGIRSWTERYDDTSTVPLLARDDITYGEPTGLGEAQRLYGTLMSVEEAEDYNYPTPRFVHDEVQV